MNVSNCPCALCRGRSAIRRHGRSVVKRLAVVSLATVLIASTAPLAHRAMFPPEREAWFDRLIAIAYAADAAFDAEEVRWEPTTHAEFISLVDEIVNQIEEERATPSALMPFAITALDYGPGRRTGVAGTYYPDHHVVALNARFFTPAWDKQSWLSVLVHELVHAQGYLSSEAQTEVIATEVVAAMANLDFPGMRADLLDGLRRDALSFAYYIARFGGGPLYGTEDINPLTWLFTEEASADPDPDRMARVAAARVAIFSPSELARVEKRIRWWEQNPNEYKYVLSAYVVRVLTASIGAACGSGVIDHAFTRHQFSANIEYSFDGKWWSKALVPEWSHPYLMPPLVVDDLAWVLRRELGVC